MLPPLLTSFAIYPVNPLSVFYAGCADRLCIALNTRTRSFASCFGPTRLITRFQNAFQSIDSSVLRACFTACSWLISSNYSSFTESGCHTRPRPPIPLPGARGVGTVWPSKRFLVSFHAPVEQRNGDQGDERVGWPEQHECNVSGHAAGVIGAVGVRSALALRSGSLTAGTGLGTP